MIRNNLEKHDYSDNLLIDSCSHYRFEIEADNFTEELGENHAFHELKKKIKIIENQFLERKRKKKPKIWMIYNFFKICREILQNLLFYFIYLYL